MAKKLKKKRQKKQSTGAPRSQRQDVWPAVRAPVPVQESPAPAEQAVAVQAQTPATQTKDVVVQAEASAEQMPAAVQTPIPAQEAQVAGQALEKSFTVVLPEKAEKPVTYSAALFLRLLPEDKARLQLRAVKAEMSLAAYCRAVLESVARRDD